ncbi:hypothetical protein OXX80_001002 [Metschnikowia pulcherrima]
MTVMVRVYSILLMLTIGVKAIDDETLSLIRTSFQASNEYWRSFSNDRKSRIGPSLHVENVSEEYYLYSQSEEQLTFTLVAPENNSGKDLARFMKQEAFSCHQRLGFESASTLMNFGVSSAVKYDRFGDAKASALYVTKDGQDLEIVHPGMLWAGLYRDGSLVNSTQPSAFSSSGPEEFINQITQVLGIQLKGFNTKWQAREGDILLVTWADLAAKMSKIIDIAMLVAAEGEIPLSQIAYNLKPYLNLERAKENILVAIRIT